MSILRTLRKHLTYANVAATLAVVLALSGTAYAALAKNSVTSATIKNGQVKSPDLKNGGVRGKDLKDDGVTGADVDESTLATVPVAATAANATNLGGLPASGFTRASTSTAGGASDGELLRLEIPNYGGAGARCEDNGTPGVADDDTVNLYYSGMGTGTVSGVTQRLATSGVTDSFTRIANRITNTSAESILDYDRLQADVYLRSADGTRAVRYSVWAWDDETTTGCYVAVEGTIVR